MHCLIHFSLFKSFFVQFIVSSVIFLSQELKSKWLLNIVEVLEKCLSSCRARQHCLLFNLFLCIYYSHPVPHPIPPSLEIIYQIQECLLQHPQYGILFVTGNKINLFLFYKISYNAYKDSHYHEQFLWLAFLYKYTGSHTTFNKTGTFSYVH